MVLAILGVTGGAQAKPLGGSETLAKTMSSANPEVLFRAHLDRTTLTVVNVQLSRRLAFFRADDLK